MDFQEPTWKRIVAVRVWPGQSAPHEVWSACPGAKRGWLGQQRCGCPGFGCHWLLVSQCDFRLAVQRRTTCVSTRRSTLASCAA